MAFQSARRGKCVLGRPPSDSGAKAPPCLPVVASLDAQSCSDTYRQSITPHRALCAPLPVDTIDPRWQRNRTYLRQSDAPP